MKKEILEIRELLVNAQQSLSKANDILLKVFSKETIDCGDGYKIPMPDLPNKEPKNKSECDGCE